MHSHKLMKENPTVEAAAAAATASKTRRAAGKLAPAPPRAH